MPGVDLNLDLPTLADSMSTIVSKLVTAVSAIETDLEAKVVPAEININAALSMNGASLTNTGAVLFVSGNNPTAAGAIYYSGGEFYAIDSTGTVQITAAGSLNFAAAGAIVGDYGGVNPAKVTYNDVAGEYRFTEDTNVWADLVADDLVLKSAAGSVRFGVMDAINTDRSFLIKGLPAAGTGLLVYDSADSSVDATGAAAVSAFTVTTLTATNPIKHGDRTAVIRPKGAGTVHATGGATYTFNSDGSLQKTSAGGIVGWEYMLVVPAGARLKTASAIVSVGAPNAALSLNIGSTEIALGVAGDSAGNGSRTTTGTITTNVTTGLDPMSNLTFYVSAAMQNLNDQLFPVAITWDHP